MTHNPHVALRQIGAVLSKCLVEKKKPTVDEMFAMLSWVMASLPAANGESGDSPHAH